MSDYHRPFAEQLAFFQQKLNLPTDRWDDIAHEAHDRSFIVAGAKAADLLDDLNGAVTKTLAEGTGLNAFRKDFKALVARNGWTGWTGEGSKAGVAWRTKVIYQTNMATSYAAGRYQQLTDPELLSVLPFWQYKHADGVMFPRPLHVAWSGLTLPPEHPFWTTHFAPNGWGCHCRIIAVHKSDYLKAITEGKGPANAPAADDIAGIDPGFAYTPGASVADELKALVQSKVAKLPAPIGQALAADAQTVLAAVATPPASVADFIAAGKRIVDALPDAGIDPLACHQALIDRLQAEVGISTPCAVASKGVGAKLVQEASRLFPDSWTAEADRLGPLYTKAKAGARGFHITEDRAPAYAGAHYVLPEFGRVPMEKGAGYLFVRTGALDNAVHELAHRLQHALPKLEALFEDLHRIRTSGEPLERLRDVSSLAYAPTEMTRKDKYADPYFGKEYPNRGAVEMMTMAMQSVLGAHGKVTTGGDSPTEWFRKVYTTDREMVDFTVGLLFHWKP